MSLTIFFAGVLTVTSLTACSAGPSQPATQPNATAPPPSVQPAPPSPVNAWLDCVECVEERKNLAALGDSAVPQLRQVLFNGPSPERLAANEQHLKTAYAALKKYEQRRGPDRAVPFTTEQEYVKRYQDAYILRNRSRAASGLGAIATPQAKTALNEAFKLDLPEDVRREVERAIKGAELPKPIPNPDATNPDVTNPTPTKPPPG